MRRRPRADVNVAECPTHRSLPRRVRAPTWPHRHLATHRRCVRRSVREGRDRATAAVGDAAAPPTPTHRARSCCSRCSRSCVWFTISFVSALVNPALGTSLAARAAEWGGSHGLGAVVTWAESEWYRLHPPRWAAPPPGAFTAAPTSPSARSARRSPRRPGCTRPPGRWLPGEGVWHPVGRTRRRRARDLHDDGPPRRGPHELRGRRRLDGPATASRAAVLGLGHPRRRPLSVHRTDLAARLEVARRRVQRRLPDGRRQRRVLHRSPDASLPLRTGCGVARRLPGRLGDRRRVGQPALDGARGRLGPPEPRPHRQRRPSPSPA